MPQTAAPAITPAALRVIGRLDPPAFDPEDFPGFSIEQIALGLTVPAIVLTEEEIEQMAKVCPVFKTITGNAR